MTYSSYRVMVPGKLLIAGEYAVLEPNQQAVVIAVDRYITAYIEPSSQNKLSLPQLGFENVTWGKCKEDIQFSVSDPQLNFIQNSVSVVKQYLDEKSVNIQPFHLTIKSDLDDPATGRKYGLGSSAAVVVAVISSILMFHSGEKIHPTLEQVYKLSAIAHLKTQKNGSAVDIAASTFGGWLCYSSLQPNWVLNELQQEGTLTKLMAKPWPNLSITPLSAPKHLRLCVGWTGEAAKTGPMVEKIEQFRSSNAELYNTFLKKTSIAVGQLLKSFELNDSIGAISSLTQNRNALIMLSEKAGITIETSKLKDLCKSAEKVGSGKSSGAGGGDCGIAFLKGDDHVAELYQAWKKAGIIPLNLNVSEEGVTVAEYNCEESMNKYYGSETEGNQTGENVQSEKEYCY